MTNILYIILALLGLGFLVFIHELGHYFAAKRVGMKIETFSIGFGKPIFSWMRGKVKWQIGFLPFGGFVKIAGMQNEKGKEPHEIKNGFFGKKPFQRIKVSFMGPFVNIVFAFVAFTIIWVSGGRNKPFHEVTHRIGYVDTESSLYEFGIRPGDEIVEYDGRKYNNFKDLIYASVLDDDKTQIKGYKINYLKNLKTPFDYTLNNYAAPYFGKEGLSTIGVLAPASYSIYFNLANSFVSPIMKDSGIEYGDRIVWADGDLIFSNAQLNSIINDEIVLITIQRGNLALQSKLPLFSISEFNLEKYEKEEIDDWRHEGKIFSRTDNFKFIPYLFNEDGVIEKELQFIEEDSKEQLTRGSYILNLQPGDKIIAVANEKVNSGLEILNKLQKRKAVIIVQRDPRILKVVSWKSADKEFDEYINMQELYAMISSIGVENKNAINNLHLLNPIELKTLNEQKEFKESFFAEEIKSYQNKIEKIKDPNKKEAALKNLEAYENNRYLGIGLKDRDVKYNPSPLVVFSDVFQEICRTFTSLVTGYLSPKYMAGPIGIMQIVHHSWSLGFLEGLFWLGVISLNLGVINLLPIPPFDGGHIVLSGIEMITKKPIKSKTMDKLIIPIIVLIIGAFIFITFHDLKRLLSSFF